MLRTWYGAKHFSTMSIYIYFFYKYECWSGLKLTHTHKIKSLHIQVLRSIFSNLIEFTFLQLSCVNSMIEHSLNVIELRCMPCWGGICDVIQQVHWDLALEHYTVHLIQTLLAIGTINLWVSEGIFSPGLSEDITIKHSSGKTHYSRRLGWFHTGFSNNFTLQKVQCTGRNRNC